MGFLEPITLGGRQSRFFYLKYLQYLLKQRKHVCGACGDRELGYLHCNDLHCGLWGLCSEQGQEKVGNSEGFLNTQWPKSNSKSNLGRI